MYRTLSWAILAVCVAVCICACSSDTLTVEYAQEGVKVVPGKVDGVTCKVNGTHVLVVNDDTVNRITVRLTGDCPDGSFTYQGRKMLTLRLDNLHLTCKDGAAIHLKNKKRTVVEVVDDTENTLVIEACEDTVNHKSSAFFAKDHVDFTGKGRLEVSALGQGCVGMRVKGRMQLDEATLVVRTMGESRKQYSVSREPFHGPFPPGFDPDKLPPLPPPSDGKPGMPPPPLSDGKPGMPPPKLKYVDAPKGVKVGKTLTVNSGSISVVTQKQGAEGIEAKNGVVINGGTVYVKSVDDAISSGGHIFINGGDVTAWSTSNDGVDSNCDDVGAITITGGTVRAMSQNGPPEEGLDCDFAPLVFGGGCVLSIGAGIGDMPSVPTNDTARQPVLLLIGLDVTEGDTVSVYDETGGEPLATFPDMPFSYSHSSSILTFPGIHVGSTYTIKSGNKTHKATVNENFTVVRL